MYREGTKGTKETEGTEDFFKVFCICFGKWYILSLPCCLFWNLCGRNAVNRVRLGTKQP